MIEFFILLFAAGAAFCIGNIVGYTTGRRAGIAHTIHKTKPWVDVERERMIDHISRQSLAFSQKQKQWIKVYDAEVIDE